jgi:hypothetical protein
MTLRGRRSPSPGATLITGNAAGTSELFREIADAFAALGRGDVILNGHDGKPAPGSTVWNAENVPLQVGTDRFEGCDLWDMSARNCEAWRAAGREVMHVPVGYHPSMTRFEMRPWAERDIDVVFTGLVNERRKVILEALAEQGLEVRVIPPGTYGAARDAVLARSKLAIAPLYYPDGIFGTLRAAHCVANGVPFLAERAPDMPKWAGHGVPYAGLVEEAVRWLRQGWSGATERAGVDLMALKLTPLVLPSAPDRWAPLRTKPTDLDGLYPPASEKPKVHIAVPLYREPWVVGHRVMSAVESVCDDLETHGIGVERVIIEGDSLICRMRQRVCHSFLQTDATHLLFCDGDIEPLSPDCVRKMLASGHDVVAGAAPFKETTGRVVVNVKPGSLEDGEMSLKHGCLEVQDAGSGFMLISRRILLRLMEAHPELLHWTPEGSPLWALFDTRVCDGTYLSEDYSFCRYVQALGEKVHVYVPATFRHWGVHGFEGSFEQWFGLTRAG